MKKIVFILFSILMCIPAMGQGKLIESSESKKPVWINRDVDRYDLLKICEENTVSLDNAKENAFKKLHNLAVNAVTTYLMKTSVGGADVNQVKNQVINTQFMKNISENTSIDTYWEHRLYKKKDLYIYYILYDFNEFEMKKVALEINQSNSSAAKALNEL